MSSAKWCPFCLGLNVLIHVSERVPVRKVRCIPIINKSADAERDECITTQKYTFSGKESRDIK